VLLRLVGKNRRTNQNEDPEGAAIVTGGDIGIITVLAIAAFRFGMLYQEGKCAARLRVKKQIEIAKKDNSK
jgi:hypothetical protein